MLQSFPSLGEWGSCSNKIAPKPVGCGDPRCSLQFLVALTHSCFVDQEAPGTIDLVCWEGRLCLPGCCQEVIWKWELAINTCWAGAVASRAAIALFLSPV